MTVKDEYTATFEPLIGLPVWGAKQGVGSFVTLELGEPRLEIFGPTQASAGASAGVVALLAKRRVLVRGAWTLWIYGCVWELFLGGGRVAHSESVDETIAAALRDLDGQALTCARRLADGGATFLFDLGGRLETRPASDAEGVDEQWMLFEPDHFVTTYLANGVLTRELAEP